MSKLYRLTDAQVDAARQAIQAMIAGYDPDGDAAGTPIHMFERALVALEHPVTARDADKRRAMQQRSQ